jgi:tetratricopeptide (TPR) repeat protein
MVSSAHVLRCLGRAPEALQYLDRALATRPRHPTALLNRGLALSDQGLWEAAIEALSAAVAEAPGNVEALHGLARAFTQLDRRALALSLAERALAISPGHPGALSVRAYLLAREQRHEEALTCLEEILRLAPGNVDALSSQGHSLLAAGRIEEARRVLERAQSLAPEHVGVLENHAAVLQRLEHSAAALGHLDRALRIDPQHGGVLFQRAGVLKSMYRHAEALQTLERLPAVDQQASRALRLRGQILLEMDRGSEAITCLDAALAQEPADAEAAVLRAMCLEGAGRAAEAAAQLAAAQLSDTHRVAFHTNRGCLLMDILARREESLECFERALALDPSCTTARLNLSFALLALGRLEEGFREMECRWSMPRAPTRAPTRALTTGAASPAPLWLGEPPLAGKTILVEAEQGFGDTLQFVRYVPGLQRRGAQVIVRATSALHGLLASLPGRPRIVPDSEPLPPHDLRCPMLSLPLACGTTLETIPAPVPYLSADPVRVQQWSRRLGQHTRPRIGLVWAGRQCPPVNHRRDMPLAQLRALLELPADFLGVQKEIPAGDRATLSSFPGLTQWGETLTDFSDTAALITHLDLLLTVDTSVLHLAGALGKPVWVMNRFAPCWRWLEDRSDSPWYPDARLFRQPAPGDWGSVVTRVKDALAGWIAQGAAMSG